VAPSSQFADHTSVSGASPDLATPSQDPEVPEQVRDPARRRRRRLTRRGRLVRAFIAAPLVVVLLWATASYTVWMLRPTSLSWSVNSVEWVRYNVPFGIGNWVADHVEQVYYSSQAPKKGGPQLKSLPKVGVRHPTAPATTATTATTAWPPAITPVFSNPLPGEGVWQPTGPSVDGGAPILVTTYRPDPNYPQIVAYVAWFDHSRTELGYYPGRYEPPNAAVRGPAMVPYSQRSRLLATFNGGFTYVDGDNGSADNGQTNEPLKDGNATLIGYTDGRVDIVNWGGGPNPGPGVAWARQSLAPIVWNGQLNPTLNTDPNSPQWGYTAESLASGAPALASTLGATSSTSPLTIRQWSASRRSFSTSEQSGRWSSTSTRNGTRSTPTTPPVSTRRWLGPTRISQPIATLSPMTATSLPSTDRCPVR
jgi:hypothetical protein